MLLRLAREEGARLLLSSPYLNLPPEHTAALLGSAAAAPLPPPLHPPLVLTAAPAAHGFSSARGARGLLPAMYAALEASLVRHARSVADAAAAGDRDGAAAAATAPLLRLRHYRRPGWTYHAKGLWLWPAAAAEVVGGGVRRPQAGEGEALAGGAGAQGDAACFDASGPVATLVGSSNFGERSARRDLELSCVIVATDPGVRRLLHDEASALLAHSEPAAEGGGAAPPGLLARAAAWITCRAL